MIILYIIIGIVTLVFLAALFSKKNHYVKREIVIQAPLQKVFDYIRFLQNQESFNTNSMEDVTREKSFQGNDGTVGYIYAWKGNKDAGEGEKEILAIDADKSLEMEIRFVKPMKATARIIMETESLSVNETKLSWSNAGSLPVPINLFIPKMRKHVAKDMEKSLLILKSLLEK
ncbi:SRPBCC family protein [Mucilaginibacter sp.]|uniref:SRPBCC family protein n=1 Tax=Mucilaginibacter sp. TaxID=1882438 RepID=UPI003D0972C7